MPSEKTHKEFLLEWANGDSGSDQEDIGSEDFSWEKKSWEMYTH